MGSIMDDRFEELGTTRQVLHQRLGYLRHLTAGEFIYYVTGNRQMVMNRDEAGRVLCYDIRCCKA
jgi:hypothetical protein